MQQRGRKSVGALAVLDACIDAIQRPEPDPTLTDEQADEWRAVVNRLPADWFPRETWGLLAQYCRHVVSARRVADLIRKAEAEDGFDVESYDRLLKMQEREGRAVAALARGMRMSQQSTRNSKASKGKVLAPPPWQD